MTTLGMDKVTLTKTSSKRMLVPPTSPNKAQQDISYFLVEILTLSIHTIEFNLL